MSTIKSVYIIYHADVISPRPSDITGMAPAKHVPASIGGAEPEAAKRIVEAFTETEGDDQYDYGYLGDEGGDVRYFPSGYKDAEGLEEAEEGEPCGMGMHRKWVGELSPEDWRVFARAYCIDLEGDTLKPERYDDTMGSLTVEYGHIPAISVDNTEGWDYPGFGYGSIECVLDSRMYVSFGMHEPQSTPANDRTGVES